jgi:two-component system, OmpR family, phosphate regulon sensor histidine kinase PhoR
MTRNIRLLLTLCLLAITGVIGLQFYWVSNYYRVSLFNFEREVNLAFEDAIKKDFQLRCDTIEQILVKQLMDTSAFIINSRQNDNSGKAQHNIINAKNKKDYTDFSHTDLPGLLTPGDSLYKRKIAKHYAKSLRSEDLEKHVVYYHIQSLGEFTDVQVRQYGFDTSRLRPILQDYLRKRDIDARFYFLASNADSTLNYIKPADSLKKAGLVITKSWSTYKWWTYDERYVRAVFENPGGYVFAKMKGILAGSLLLIVLVALCIGLLIKALLREKELSVIKNDFINNITHELKTPLATVSAAIEALQDFDVDKEKANRYLGHAKNEMSRLTKLIDSILTISLFEKNKPALQPEQLSAEKIIRSIMEALTLTAEKPVQYQFSNSATSDAIVADNLLFHQAMANVLDNAVKYSGSKAEINISCYTESNYFCIQCSDMGEGIAANSMPFIFEKFYREPRPGHTIKGYGLGLNYVQEIMKAHKGKIELSSIKGKGTSVTLSWPV